MCGSVLALYDRVWGLKSYGHLCGDDEEASQPPDLDGEDDACNGMKNLVTQYTTYVYVQHMNTIYICLYADNLKKNIY